MSDSTVTIIRLVALALAVAVCARPTTASAVTTTTASVTTTTATLPTTTVAVPTTTVEALEGEWVPIFNCVYSSRKFTFTKSIEEIAQMARWPQARLKFTLPEGDHPDYTIESRGFNSFAIQQLRKNPPQSMSHGGNLTAAQTRADGGPYDPRSDWIGTPTAVNRTGATCGWAYPLETNSPTVQLYWSCDNGDGLHVFRGIHSPDSCAWATGEFTRNIALYMWQPKPAPVVAPQCEGDAVGVLLRNPVARICDGSNTDVLGYMDNIVAAIGEIQARLSAIEERLDPSST